MFQLFNYSTLHTRLCKSTRTLHITLNREQGFTHEMLFELESLLAWCTSRVEICSLFFTSTTPLFSTGIDRAALVQMSAAQVEKTQTRLHKIVFSLMQLPQTVVMDYRRGAFNWAMELGLGADVRICAKGAELKLDHTHLGLVPAAGGMGFLSLLVPVSHARQWVATGNPIAESQLLASGLIQTIYDESNHEEVVRTVLTTIFQQAPVQRVQAKLGLFESQRENFERAWTSDRKIAKASLISEDWKTMVPAPEAPAPFMPAKSMSYAVKLSLVKSDSANDAPETTH